MKALSVLILLVMTGCTTASRQAGNMEVNITKSKDVRIYTKGNDATQDAAKATEALRGATAKGL